MYFYLSTPAQYFVQHCIFLTAPCIVSYFCNVHLIAICCHRGMADADYDYLIKFLALGKLQNANFCSRIQCLFIQSISFSFFVLWKFLFCSLSLNKAQITWYLSMSCLYIITIFKQD